MESSGSTSTSLGRTTVTASGTAHTKGSYATVLAATSFEATGMLIQSTLTRTGATDTGMLVDVALGAAASERIVVANWYRGHQEYLQATYIPLRIPSGERISARAQSAVASKTLELGVTLISGGDGWSGASCGGRVTTYGADTVTSNQVQLTDTASSNAESAWTEITAATTNPIRWLIPVQGAPAADTTVGASEYLIDIGVGGSGSEVVLLPNITGQLTTNESVIHPVWAYPVNIPAGTRLSARFQQSLGASEAPTLSILGID